MDFLDALLGALGDLGAQLVAAIVFLFNLVVSVFQFIWQVLQLVGSFFLQLMGDIGNFFAHIWNTVFKGIVTGIFNGLSKFGQFLANIFGPVVKFLARVSQFITRIYRAYVMPILRIIRIARAFLVLLRALGVKWAGKLDSILGQIQADIQRAFLTIRGYLNVIIDLLNILADPSNLIRRPTTLLSLIRIWRAGVRMFTGLPPGFFLPSRLTNAPAGLGGLPLNFDPTNPLMNPPASYYLAFDSGVPDFSFLGPGETISDDSIDDIDSLDFFDNDILDDLICDDTVQCLAEGARAALMGN